MGELLKNYDVWGAIWTTIQLAVLSAIGATVVGTIVAIMRVSPVAVLRGLGTSYVNIFRNTPLTVLLVMSVLGLAFILGLSFSDDFAATPTGGLWRCFRSTTPPSSVRRCARASTPCRPGRPRRPARSG